MGRKSRSSPPKWKIFKGLRALGLLLGLAIFLAAVAAIAKYTREGLRDSERFTIPFADIDCPAPPAEGRADFLAEVQYLQGLPDRVQLLDNDLAARLAEAFARHPWVEHVDEVRLVPPHKIQVQLSFRTPVLEVMLAEGAAQGEAVPPEARPGLDANTVDEATWVVDAGGVVLPGRGSREPLPVLYATARPAGLAGQLWGDAKIAAAARLAGALRPHEDQFKLRTFETTAQGLVLRTSSGSRILWGHAPGAEGSGEAAASQKIERLLQFCEAHGGLDQSGERYEHDVRPLASATHRPLARADSP